MSNIKTKRVYDPEEANDGYRVFVDKLWPRGVKKEELHYDLWAKDIAPSTELRKWFHGDKDKHWSEFEERYIKELQDSQSVKDFIAQIKEKETVTLLYASNNALQNHALVLQQFIKQQLNP